jgi:hypothetical protein
LHVLHPRLIRDPPFSRIDLISCRNLLIYMDSALQDRVIIVGKRVLIVEDELLVALLIEDFLTEIGCDVVGLCGRVQTALDTVRTKAIDLAVLAVNLHGEQVYPVAALLEAR